MKGKGFWIAFVVFGSYLIISLVYTLASIEREKRVLSYYAEFLKPHVWQLDLEETTRLARVMISSGMIVKVEVYQVYSEGGVEEVEKFCEVGDTEGKNLSEFERVLLKLGLITIKRYDEKNLPSLMLYQKSPGRIIKIGFVRFYVVRRYFYFYLYSFLLSLAIYILITTNSKLMDTKRELQKANEELNAMVEELENTIEELEKTQEQLVQSEKMATIGQLVASISHDMNTPAGIIYTSTSELRKYLEKLKELYEKGEITRSFFEEFLENSENLLDLIERNVRKISDLVRSLKTIALHETEAKPMKFDLCDILRDVLTALHPKLRKTKVKVHVECPEGGVEMKSHPGALSQVLTNLIDNSVMHAFDDGNLEGNIWIRVEDKGGYVEIVFEDDGKGMDEETKKRAFEPFYSTRIGSGGTGLGLFIVYSLVVEKLGGEINLESEPGKGTRFTIVIPKVL